MSGRVWFLSLVALAGLLLPDVFLDIALVGAIVAIGALFAKRDDARAESARLTREHEAELAELDQENARLHAELTAAQVGRHLRVVPPPSDDEWFGRLYDENGGHRG